MTKMYSISLPVKPHIEKYFGSVIYPKKNPIVWWIIKPYLIYKVNDGLSNDQRCGRMKKLTGQISIKISESKVRLYGIHIRQQSVMSINQVLDFLFGKELFIFVRKCEINSARYKGYYKAIEEFCDEFGIEIESDISKDALLKIYKRHGKRYDKKSVPHLSLAKY